MTRTPSVAPCCRRGFQLEKWSQQVCPSTIVPAFYGHDTKGQCAMVNPPIGRLDCGYGEVQFFKPEELAKWIKTEMDTWEWTNDKKVSPPEVALHMSKVLSRLSSLHSRLTQKSHTPEQTIESLKDVFSNKHFLHSRSNNGQHVMQVKEHEGAKVAAELLGGLVEIDLGGEMQSVRPSSALLRGMTRASLFKLGVLNTAEAEKAALQSLVDEWTRVMNEQRARQQSLTNEFDLAAQTARDGREEQRQLFVEAQEARQADYDELRKKFLEEMTLAAPVEYWKAEDERHDKLRLRYGRASLVAGVGTLIVVALYVWLFEPTVANGGQNFADYIPWIRYAAGFAVFVTLGLWLLRVLVRLYLASVHLQQDAKERAVMATTFLSLIENEKTQQHVKAAEDRILILQALFRHSSDGVIVDDAMPDWAATLLSRWRGKGT